MLEFDADQAAFREVIITVSEKGLDIEAWAKTSSRGSDTLGSVGSMSWCCFPAIYGERGIREISAVRFVIRIGVSFVIQIRVPFVNFWS